MKTLCLVSWKRGTGKTTIACNLAERALNAGINSALCDFDPEATTLHHCSLRQQYSPEAPRLKAMSGQLTLEGIAALRRESAAGNIDLLICDMPGGDNFVMDRAMAEMDLLLIPVAATPYEVIVTNRLIKHGKQKGWNMALIPNNLPSSRKRAVELRESLEPTGVEIAPVNLIRRVHHSDAALRGLGVCEAFPGTAADREIKQLWSWVHTKIKMEIDHATSTPANKTGSERTDAEANAPNLGNPAHSTNRPDFQEISETEPQTSPASFNDMSDNDMSDAELRAALEQRGLEMYKARSTRRIISRENNVKNKKRVTVHLPTELRIAMEPARIETNHSLSYIVEDSMVDWFQKVRIDLPEFRRTTNEGET